MSIYGDIETALREAERPAPPTPYQYLVSFEAEHYWRSRGEQAIRAEMERALERRRRRRAVA